MRRRRILRVAFVALMCGLSAAAVAQDKYPAKTIQLVVPFAPGGSTDIIARQLATRMEALLGRSIVVENRSGASGTIGGAYVAQSAPDGYTILFGSDQVVATGGMENVAYDGASDLAPIGLVTSAPIALLAGPAMPAKTFAELETLLKANPGKYAYGSPGEGSIINLAGELFKRAANVEVTHIPYRGSGPAMVDLVGGHIPLMVGTVGTSIDQVRSGAVRMIMTFTDKRLESTPDVPTAKEAGLQNLVVSSFSGLFVPSKTPSVIVEALHRATDAAVNDQGFKEAMAKIGVETVTDTSPQTARRMVGDMSANFKSVFLPDRPRAK